MENKVKISYSLISNLKMLIFPIVMISAFLSVGLWGQYFAFEDYGYEYRFGVTGGHGSLCAMRGNKAVDSSESPIILIGGKNGGFNLEFVATPDEGYRVKQWTINGQIVEGNNTNIFWCGYVRSNETVVTVEFMLEE